MRRISDTTLRRVAAIPGLVTTGLLAVLPVSGMAQLVDQEGKVVEAVKVRNAPIIDGVLDDEAWSAGTAIEDLHQVTPAEFDPPTESSRIVIVYTNNALYVAGRFRDSEPDKIGARVLRQGDYSFGEDSFTVMVDPFNNERSGYAFDLTANAVRSQAVYANVTSENWDWRGIWHGATSRTDDGWIAEIEIPFKTLSFNPHNEVWGLNFARYIGRKSEHIGWVSANRTQNPAVSGKMIGLAGIDQGMGLDIVPSIRATEARDFVVDASDMSTDPAIDVFYKLTPAMTAALTVNTDFSGTGVDARQINLTRFGLFFPERRAFFLQDTDIFEFGRIGGTDNFDEITTISRVERESGRPFFSRRIGLSDSGETIDIEYGGKLTGRAGRWDVGILGIRQDAFETLDSSDLFVARLAANVLEESSVGVVLTHGDPNSDEDNTLAGADFRYLNTRLDDGRTIEAGLWYQQSETEGIDGDDAAYGISLSAPNATGLRGAIGYKELQENFYPALGFVNRVNVSDLIAEVGYTWYLNSKRIRNIYAGIDHQRIETLQGDLQSQITTLRPFEIRNHASDNLQLHYLIMDEVLTEAWEISEGVIIPVGEYSFDQYCISVAASEFRPLTGSGFLLRWRLFWRDTGRGRRDADLAAQPVFSVPSGLRG